MRFEGTGAGVVMLSHLGVHPEGHRGLLGGQMSMTQGPSSRTMRTRDR